MAVMFLIYLTHQLFYGRDLALFLILVADHGNSQV